MSAKPVIHNGSLYDYTAGTLCGVLVKESVMRKLAALQTEHLRQVKSLLADEAEKGNVFSSMWTLHYPKGKQTSVHYIDTSEPVARRISNAVHANQPRHHPLVFVASSMAEAEEMADAHFAATNTEPA